MAESIMFRLMRGQVEATTETVEAWKAEHRAAMRKRRRRHCPFLARLACRRQAHLQVASRRRARKRNSRPERDERKIQFILDEALGLLRAHRENMRSFEAAGHVMEIAAKLDKAIAGLEEVRQGLLQHWPVFTQQDLDDGWAEHLRGECLTVDKTFAQIAGMDIEAWHKKVEAYRRH